MLSLALTDIAPQLSIPQRFQNLKLGRADENPLFLRAMTPDFNWLRIAAGDESHYRQLFNYYYRPLCNYARKYLQDLTEAESTVQDTFIYIWEKRTELNEINNVRAYLYRATYTRCIAKLRSSAKVVSIDSHEFSASKSADTNTLESELLNAFNAALEEMPAARKQVFQLVRQEGKTYKEAAELLDISPKTVENQMGRALAFLKDKLQHLLALPVLIGSLVQLYHWISNGK